MIWAGIVGSTVIGPYKVDEGVKLNSVGYCKFLDGTFFKWYNKQSRDFKKNCIFMQDNAPSHASRLTSDHLAKKGFKDDKLMVWPACSPDLNPIENMWSIIKADIYKENKQYSSKTDLWKAIQDSCSTIKPETVTKLTESMDNRLIKIIEQKGNYINM